MAEINLPDGGYDIGAFRKYSTDKNVPPLGEKSLRVFFMGQGRIGKAVEISLDSGIVKVWPDWLEQSEPKTFRLSHPQLGLMKSALEEKDLAAIPVTIMPSMDGSCHLLEMRNESGYYWRLHRNSPSGYFRSLVSLVDLLSSPNNP